MKFTFEPESRPLAGFTIKRAIYRGGFGEVYYGLSDAGREVALKLLQHNTDIELRGVQQCLNLSHPNLVTIFDVRQDGDGDHWIVMEYVAGETLDSAVRRHPEGMPVELVRKWLPGLGAGVSFLHSRGIVHRDLKPANIFMENGTVKVGDVGLSKFITPSRRSAHTQSVGTVYYMAPEVAKGRYGKEVDVYAVGIILYEMLTGQVPFDGESTGEILMKHLTEQPDLARLPPRIQPVIAKALHKAPEQRFHSLEEFQRTFDDAVLGRSGDVQAPNDSAAATPGRVRLADQVESTFGRHSLSNHRQRVSRRFSVVVHRLLHPGNWPLIGLLIGLFLGFTRDGNDHEIVSWYRFIGSSLIGLGIGVIASGHYWGKRLMASARTAAMAPPPPERPVFVRHWISESTASRLCTACGSAVLAVPFAALLAALLAVLKPSLFMAENGIELDLAMLGLFTGVAVIGAWATTIVHAFAKPLDPRWLASRWSFALVGALIGAAAWGLDEYLLVDFPAPRFAHMGGMLKQIGDQPLMLEGHGPTLLGYVAFFTSLFWIRDWSSLVRMDRKRRFRVGSVVKTALLAWLVMLIFAFPTAWGLAWAVVLSCAVQLASPWNGETTRDGRVVRR